MIKAANATEKQLNLVKLHEQTKKTLEQEILNYRDEAQKQRKIIFQLEKERDRYINEASDLTQKVSHTDTRMNIAIPPYTPPHARLVPNPALITQCLATVAIHPDISSSFQPISRHCLFAIDMYLIKTDNHNDVGGIEGLRFLLPISKTWLTICISPAQIPVYTLFSCLNQLVWLSSMLNELV